MNGVEEGIPDSLELMSISPYVYSIRSSSDPNRFDYCSYCSQASEGECAVDVDSIKTFTTRKGSEGEKREKKKREKQMGRVESSE